MLNDLILIVTSNKDLVSRKSHCYVLGVRISPDEFRGGVQFSPKGGEGGDQLAGLEGRGLILVAGARPLPHLTASFFIVFSGR